MGKVLLKTHHILRAGPAPGIDHLVVVAHHADIAQALVPIIDTIAQQAHQLILRQVAVLELVHVDIVPALLIAAQHLRLSAP